MANRPGPNRLLPDVRRLRPGVRGVREFAGGGVVAGEPGRVAAVVRGVHAVAFVGFRGHRVGLFGDPRDRRHAAAAGGLHPALVRQAAGPGAGRAGTAGRADGRAAAGYKIGSRNLRAARKMTAQKMILMTCSIAPTPALAPFPAASRDASRKSLAVGGSYSLGSRICWSR